MFDASRRLSSITFRWAVSPLWVLTTCLSLACFLTAPLPASASKQDPEALAFYEDAVEFRDLGNVEAAVIQLKNALQKDADYGEARALLGELYIELGNGASAEKELQAAAQLGVPDDRLWIHLGYARLLQGHYDEILAELDDNPPSNDRAAEWTILRGEALYGLGRRDEAADALSRATLLDPQDSRAFIRLAEILAALRENRDAELRVDRALEIDPTLVRALLVKAELRRLAGDTEQAMAYFDKALATAPDGIASRLGRVTVLIDLNEDVLAKIEIDALRGRSVEHPMVEYLDAVILARQQKFSEAQTALMNIGPQLDDYPPALLFRATLHYALDELEQSRALLGRLLKLVPSSRPAQKLLAATLIKQGAASEAARLLEGGRQKAANDPQLFLLLGSAYLHMENYTAATAALEQALAMAPGNLRSVMQLAFGQLAVGYLDAPSGAEPGQPDDDDILLNFLRGLAHLQSEDYAQALALAEQLAAYDGESPLAAYLRGGAYFGLGRLDESRADFERVIEKAPRFLPAKNNLARLHLRNGETGTAKTLSEEVLTQDPSNVDAMMLLAEIARQYGQTDEALSWLKKTVSAAPSLIEPRLAMARLHMESGDIDVAQELAEQTSATFQGEPRALALQAEIQLRRGNNQDALPLLSRLIEMQPDSTAHRYRLADVYLGQGDRGLAKDQLFQVIQLDPRQLTAYLRLIDMELEDGKGSIALSHVERMRKAFPEAPAVDQVQGRVLMRLGRPSEALEAYRRAWAVVQTGELAVALYEARTLAEGDRVSPLADLLNWVNSHPKDSRTRMFLAGKLLDEGFYDESISQYEMLLVERPEDAVILNNLAWLYHQTKDSRDIAYAERALASAPSEAAIMDTLGWILLNRGELERAESILASAASQAPGDPDIGYHFAAALERSGRQEEAKSLLSRILSEHREFASADAAQALMKKLEAN